jgi:hypothetical protein
MTAKHFPPVAFYKLGDTVASTHQDGELLHFGTVVGMHYGETRLKGRLDTVFYEVKFEDGSQTEIDQDSIMSGEPTPERLDGSVCLSRDEVQLAHLDLGLRGTTPKDEELPRVRLSGERVGASGDDSTGRAELQFLDPKEDRVLARVPVGVLFGVAADAPAPKADA